MGDGTATFVEALYQVIVPPSHPVAESVTEPDVVLLDGVAVGKVGAWVVLITTEVVAVLVQLLALVTLIV